MKIHEGVKWIRDSAFAECDNLRNVELPSSVEYIGDSSFISTETLKVDSAFGGLLYAFTGSYAVNFDVKKLIIKDKTYYLPLVFNPKQQYFLNRCNKASEFPDRQFYKDAACTELKQNTALYLYENHMQIYYSNIKTITSGKTTSYTDSKLTKNKIYYYKVRAYKTINNKKVYGPYSSVKYIKIK